ncbi:hypothetical protein SAMN04489760_1358 [Syntrophus gentianae]|uniref:Uncharacterized protein n=1 Tax=Syntrophus gentianae TaxID=43775 RepID=A0A1H8AEM4_9BACT|nr:hypothetical protein [Syntrophus gentianae]SEM69215.1 hypothetical protein SAMN04489760_1358 [Syntrophus gentianae]
MVLLHLLSFMVSLWAIPVLAGDLPSLCLMQPPYHEMRLPDHGLTWLPDEDFSGGCGDVQPEQWIRKSLGSVDLLMYADGPRGSGRTWDVAVGVSEKGGSKPLRGVCLQTSTEGWRTLQRYRKGPLPWMDDLDADGKAELIIWDSFPLHENASLAEYGLVAWVYRLASRDSFVIDLVLSRRLARSIAEEYRAPLGNEGLPYPGKLRTDAAEALEKFANERCRILKKHNPER